MNRIILIDGGGAQFRAIFAHRNNPAIPATYTYLNMVSGYLNKLEVTLNDTIIVAQDYGNWRKDIDKNYKAQRQAAREEKEDKQWWLDKYEEFNQLYKKLDMALPFYFIKKYKCEADDIASVACRYYKDKEIILISSDKDWEMLLTFTNVKIYSPISKKFKDIKNPMKVLLDKIQGDISDNLLEKPSSEADFEKRKKIVDLINPLPDFVEKPIKEELDKIMPKNLYLHKIPFNSIRLKFAKIYGLEE